MSHVENYRKLHPLVRNYQTAKWGFEGKLEQCIYSSKLEAKSARLRAAIAYEESQPKQPFKVGFIKVIGKPGRPRKIKPPKVVRKRGAPRLDKPRSPRLLLALSLVAQGVKRYHAAQAAGVTHQAVYEGLKRYPQYEAQRRASLIALLTHKPKEDTSPNELNRHTRAQKT